MMMNVILDYIDDKNYKKAFASIFKPTIVVSIAMLVYYVVIKYFSINISHSEIIGYNDGFINGIGYVLTNIWRVLTSQSFQAGHTANIIITIIVFILFIYFVYISFKIKEYRFFILLMFLWLLSIFSMNIILGSALPIRSKLAIAFYPAFILLMLFIFNKNVICKYIILTLSIFIMFYHTYYIVKYQTAYYISYMYDVTTSYNLINKIYDKYPDIYNGQYKIAFYGKIDRNNYIPLLKGKDFFGVSFFSNGEGYPSDMLQFLKLMSFPMNIELGNIPEKAQKEVSKMPVYPNNDCIKLFDDTVVVKLSD